MIRSEKYTFTVLMCRLLCVGEAMWQATNPHFAQLQVTWNDHQRRYVKILHL